MKWKMDYQTKIYTKINTIMGDKTLENVLKSK